MTTYYGVWSGKDWYQMSEGLFHTPSQGVAMAQALIANRIWEDSGWEERWEVRQFGKKGLPVEKEEP